MKHQKHSNLAKPILGHFGRQEWAIMGTPCTHIQQVAHDLADRLASRYRLAFVDADHHTADTETPLSGFALEYTDKINFQRVDFQEKPGPWQQRNRFNEMDLVLVNGNHFAAARQIVVLDRRKFESLQRKLDRLTQVDLFLTDPADPHFTQPDELPEALKNHLPNWAQIPVLNLQDTVAIAAFLEPLLSAPPLQALILAGGKSTRMGQDKAGLDYHDMPQWQYLRNQLEQAGLKDIFISCRAEQARTFAPAPVISDTILDLGPMGAILSAFRHNPDAAWLVLACDLPLLDAATIRFLVENRRPSAVATAFRQAQLPGWETAKTPEEAGFPEPLIAIWEPKSYLNVLQFLVQGVSCVRKVLINSPTHLLDAPDPATLLNVNTPEERARILKQLHTRASV